MLQVSFPGVLYSRPETPTTIRLAIALLEGRLHELEGPAASTDGRRPMVNQAAPVGQHAQAAHRGVRWFAERWPRVTLRTGERVILRSPEELKEFLERNGLRPHKRGDASMLLWQVRRRLGLDVEAVSRPAE